jgi:hypothetical protein
MKIIRPTIWLVALMVSLFALCGDADAKGPLRTLLSKCCSARRVQQAVPQQSIESVTVVVSDSVPLLVEDTPLLPRSLPQGPVRRMICNGTTCRLE